MPSNSPAPIVRRAARDRCSARGNVRSRFVACDSMRQYDARGGTALARAGQILTVGDDVSVPLADMAAALHALIAFPARASYTHRSPARRACMGMPGRGTCVAAMGHT